MFVSNTKAQHKRVNWQRFTAFISDDDVDFQFDDDGAGYSSDEGSQQRRKRQTPNVCVISGASGCGKTCAIYACAKELGFNVSRSNISEIYACTKELGFNVSSRN